MFAPKVAKPQAKAIERATSKTTPASTRDALAVAPDDTLAPRGPLWDFGKVPVFPPDRASSAAARQLIVGPVDDPLERAADRVADEVMRAPGPSRSMAAARAQVGRDSAASEAATAPSKTGASLGGVRAVLRSPGQPLDRATRAFFEPRFGHDLSSVRIHTGAEAEHSAAAVNAAAYTVGRDIVFAAGRYDPLSPDGGRLLAHEIAHVMQTSATDGPAVIRRQQPAPPASAAPSAAPAVVAPTITQADYDASVALIQTRNPTLYGYLHQGQVGNTVRVRTVHLPIQAPTPGGPTAIDFFFDLTITVGNAPPGARAAFDIDGPFALDMGKSPATATQRLPMAINAPPSGATNATAQLAEQLLHEGLHMLIKMDRVMERRVPGATGLQTGTLASLNTYLTRARASPRFTPLQSDLSAVIDLYFTSNPNTFGAPTTLAEYNKIANTVIDRIIEERFAVDQQRQGFPGGMVAATTNDAIARGYLARYLADEGVSLAASGSDVTRLIAEVAALLNDIPPNLGATAPASAGSAAPAPSSAPSASPPAAGSAAPRGP
jgi:hypothetical protein